jgi:hypothetical protein
VEWVEERRGSKASKRLPATGIIFRETQAEHDIDWHPTPRRQCIINLDAGVKITASDGESRVIGVGEVILVEDVRSRAARLPKRPRVFFEEWDDPLISGIGWVSELVEIAGGIDIFADRRNQSAAGDRVVTAEEVVAREPDLIIGSWCGKKFRPERVAARPGFDRIPAVQHLDLYEIKSSLILQPGPAALTDGLAELEKIIRRWAGLLA